MVSFYRQGWTQQPFYIPTPRPLDRDDFFYNQMDSLERSVFHAIKKLKGNQETQVILNSMPKSYNRFTIRIALHDLSQKQVLKLVTIEGAECFGIHSSWADFKPRNYASFKARGNAK